MLMVQKRLIGVLIKMTPKISCDVFIKKDGENISFHIIVKDDFVNHIFIDKTIDFDLKNKELEVIDIGNL